MPLTPPGVWKGPTHGSGRISKAKARVRPLFQGRDGFTLLFLLLRVLTVTRSALAGESLLRRGSECGTPSGGGRGTRLRNEKEGTFRVVMALQKTLAWLLLLTLLSLELVQPSYGQSPMYQRFLRQHVDPVKTVNSNSYCNMMMQRRRMTANHCKYFNTFIHDNIWNIRSICSAPTIKCKNGQMNCHEGLVSVTDCKETGSSRFPNCRYQPMASTRLIVIACQGNPPVPVHFDK